MASWWQKYDNVKGAICRDEFLENDYLNLHHSIIFSSQNFENLRRRGRDGVLLVTATNRGFKEQLVSSWQPKMTINLDDNEARELQPPYKTDQGPTDVAYSGPILIIRNQGEKNDI